jgi:hypothetical protein
VLKSFLGFSTFLVAIFATLTINVSAGPQTDTCLPIGVQAADIVRVVELPSRSSAVTMKTITVADSLKSIKAKCSKGNLVDRRKKEIKFFRVEGCWGNPPEDYLEIQARQRRELADLKKKYTVIEMLCNRGLMQMIH